MMIQSAFALRLDLAIFVCRVAKREKQKWKISLRSCLIQNALTLTLTHVLINKKHFQQVSSHASELSAKFGIEDRHYFTKTIILMDPSTNFPE